MENLLEYLLKSAGVLSIFVLVYHLLLRKLTFFKANRAFLLIGMMASVLVPFIEITQTVYVQEPQLLLTPQELNALMARPAVIAEPATFDYWELALYAYIAVVLFFVGKMLVELNSLLRLLKSGRFTRSGSFIMVTLSRKLTPFSFFNYICYSENEQESPELELIIDHEKVHARQWHSLDLLATHLYCALFWINPLAWLLKRQIGENLEFLADAKAKTKNSKGMHYERTLLSAAASHMQPALANNFFTPFIKKRIIMLQKEASAKWNAYKYALILPVIVLFLYSFNVVEQIEYIPQPESKPSKVQVRMLDDENTDSSAPKNRNSASNTSLASTMASSVPVVTSKVSMISQSISFNITATDDEAYLKEKKEFLKKQYGVDFKYSRLKIENGRILSIKLSLNDNKGYKASQSFSSDKGIPEICVKGRIEDELASWAMGKCASTTSAKSYSILVPEPAPALPGYVLSGDLGEIEMSTDGLLHLLEADSLVGMSKVELERMNLNLDSLRVELKKQFAEINLDSIQSLYAKRLATGYHNTEAPLVIMNGMEIDPAMLENLDPEIVESLRVLKNDKDIRVYGAPGAHGVILVETDATNTGSGFSSSQFLRTKDSILDVKGYEIELERLEAQFTRDTLMKLRRKELELAREELKKSRAALIERRVEAQQGRELTQLEADRLFATKATEHVFVTRDMSEAGFEKLADKMKAQGHELQIKTHRMRGDTLRKLKIEVDGVQYTYVTEKGIAELRIVYLKNQEAPRVSMLPHS